MRSIILLVLASNFFAFTSLSSQSIYYNCGLDNVVRLEVNKPFFEDNNVFDFLTTDTYLSGEFKVGQSHKIALELPISRIGFQDIGFPVEGETGIGNLSVAYQFRNLSNSNYFEAKLRLPTSGDLDQNAFLSGLFTDFTERFTSSLPSTTSIEPSYFHEGGFGDGGYYRLNPGLKGIFASDDVFEDFEMLLDLNALIGYRNESIDINGGLTTTSILTESDIDFGDRVLRNFVTTFTYVGSSFQPGLILRIPWGQGFGFYDIAVGVQLSYVIGRTNKSSDTEKDIN